MRDPYDYYTIKVAKQDHYHDGVQRVDRRSPRLWKLVDQFALYLKREQHYDFPLFDVDGDGHNVAPYLFGNGGVWLGACALKRTASAGLATETPWILHWAWLHPYMRRRSLLAKAWPQLEAAHGQFLILGPLSAAMERFVEARGVAEDRVAVLR
jgi:hypothetical protein